MYVAYLLLQRLGINYQMLVLCGLASIHLSSKNLILFGRKSHQFNVKSKYILRFYDIFFEVGINKCGVMQMEKARTLKV